MKHTALTGESPYYLKNLSSGQYELLVIGKRKESLGSLRFKFTIERDNLCDPMIHLSSAPTSNGSVAVTFREECFTVPGSEGTVQFQCSIAGRDFAPCEFVYEFIGNTICDSHNLFPCLEYVHTSSYEYKLLIFISQDRMYT